MFARALAQRASAYAGRAYKRDPRTKLVHGNFGGLILSRDFKLFTRNCQSPSHGWGHRFNPCRAHHKIPSHPDFMVKAGHALAHASNAKHAAAHARPSRDRRDARRPNPLSLCEARADAKRRAGMPPRLSVPADALGAPCGLLMGLTANRLCLWQWAQPSAWSGHQNCTTSEPEKSCSALRAPISAL